MLTGQIARARPEAAFSSNPEVRSLTIAVTGAALLLAAGDQVLAVQPGDQIAADRRLSNIPELLPDGGPVIRGTSTTCRT